jgi:hypothetical protein
MLRAFPAEGDSLRAPAPWRLFRREIAAISFRAMPNQPIPAGIGHRGQSKEADPPLERLGLLRIAAGSVVSSTRPAGPAGKPPDWLIERARWPRTAIEVEPREAFPAGTEAQDASGVSSGDRVLVRPQVQEPVPPGTASRSLPVHARSADPRRGEPSRLIKRSRSTPWRGRDLPCQVDPRGRGGTSSASRSSSCRQGYRRHRRIVGVETRTSLARTDVGWHEGGGVVAAVLPRSSLEPRAPMSGMIHSLLVSGFVLLERPEAKPVVEPDPAPRGD